jgi:UDP-2,3-diacylglucosamine hydrolase
MLRCSFPTSTSTRNAPAITQLFGQLPASEARGAEALYILGDLFEGVGRRRRPVGSRRVRRRSPRGARSRAARRRYFIRGNRDFLLGDDYAQRARMRILPDPPS